MLDVAFCVLRSCVTLVGCVANDRLSRISPQHAWVHFMHQANTWTVTLQRCQHDACHFHVSQAERSRIIVNIYTWYWQHWGTWSHARYFVLITVDVAGHTTWMSISLTKYSRINTQTLAAQCAGCTTGPVTLTHGQHRMLKCKYVFAKPSLQATAWSKRFDKRHSWPMQLSLNEQAYCRTCTAKSNYAHSGTVTNSPQNAQTGQVPCQVHMSEW